ncbi:UNVERIFIED_CONTAM: Tdpoz1 [Trichonephila clavipes]
MDCKGICKKNGYTFTWVTENFSYCWEKNGEYISSPEFATNTIKGSCWRLELYPKGYECKSKDFISFYLHRKSGFKDENFESIACNIAFELSFIAIDGSVLVTKLFDKNDFHISMKWGTSAFVKCEEVFRIRRNDYLPGNVLTTRCRIWEQNKEDTEYGHSFARTRIAVERRSFVWNIKQFSSIVESICELPSASEKNSVMTLKFFPSGGRNSETFIRVKVRIHDYKLKFFTFRLYLVDTSGNTTECLNDEVAFTTNIKTALFMFPTYTKEKLLDYRNLYLPNDVLKLHCECAFATGIVLEQIEYVCCECPVIQKKNLESKKVYLDATNILKENLESLYSENLLCDTKLETKTGSFPAHKNILSARSPVFKTMFANDMREKNEGCVEIEDLDDDIVQRLLLYIYTVKLQDLQWDSACNLYAAADKYEILSLKTECSFFLKDNLTQDNACDLLILAGMHQDEDFKSTIQDYILNHRDIFKTNEWKGFMKVNSQLAAELLYLLVKE